MYYDHMKTKNIKQVAEFNSAEYELLCEIYDRLLYIQKRSTTAFDPENELDRKPFMLKNIKDELETVINKYCIEDADSDRPTYYRLVDGGQS
jgi:hypothetical protein